MVVFKEADVEKVLQMPVRHFEGIMQKLRGTGGQREANDFDMQAKAFFLDILGKNGNS